MRDGVHLITYVDRLGGSTFVELADLLDGPLGGLFAGIHLLPFFYPIDGADAGFDPVDHTAVDRRLGTWADVCLLAERYELMADLIVNHVSSESDRFLDFVANGEASPYAGMFLGFEDVFPGGATEADLLSIYRPRSGLPFTGFTLADGTRRLLWTTFTATQVDIAADHPAARAYLGEVLDRLTAAGVCTVRLDAAGYAVKTPGTSCFLTPETFAFVDWLTAEAHRRDLEVLVEVHAHHSRQAEALAHVDRVYDFGLPVLLLDALFTGDCGPLRAWLRSGPHPTVTVLDTHDGIGVIDVGPTADMPGLLSSERIHGVVERIHANSGGVSRLATGSAASNVDLYQVNCTYYDALGADDVAYLTARAVQFFSPGVPQVYYVGLLAGHNDGELLARTGVGRDVNRHYYDRAEVEHELRRPVVRALLGLIRWRGRHEAFGGDCAVLDAEPGVLAVRRTNGASWAELRVDAGERTFLITASGLDHPLQSLEDLVALDR